MVDAFNGDISDWNISSVTGMAFMFSSAYAFNGDLSSWDTSRVTNMGGMFQHTRAFNGNISDWDVSSVRKITNIFRSSAFDQNLGNWYITLNNTAIDRAGVPGIVGAISAQNSELDGRNLVYRIGPSDDMEHFEIIDGMLRLKSLKANPAKNVYEANITASDGTVFGTNNSRAISVMVVTSQNNPPPLLRECRPRPNRTGRFLSGTCDFATHPPYSKSSSTWVPTLSVFLDAPVALVSRV